MSESNTLRDGWIQPENVLAAVLRNGIEDVYERLAANTLDAYFARVFFDETPAKRVQIKGMFAKRDTPEIIEGWPASPAVFPCYAIRLMPEESGGFVGDQGPLWDFSDGRKGALSSMPWTTHVGVWVYGRSPEQAKWLYHLAKYIFAAHVKVLAETFVGFKPSGTEHQPENIVGVMVWKRQLQLRCDYIQGGHIDADPEDFSDIADIVLPVDGGVQNG